MKEVINQLAHALTGKEHITECTEDELRQMVRLYPFFGPAHLLLAKKVTVISADEEAALMQKASLYFPNPLWFDQLMNETGITGNDPVNAGVAEQAHSAILEVPTTEEEVVQQSIEPEEISFTSPDDLENTILETSTTNEEVVEQADEPREVPSASPVFEDTILEVPATAEEVVEQAAEPAASAELTDTEEEDQVILPPLPSLKIEPLDASKMELSFEPYHTVDYFASQGIRFREEEKPKDRLSHQLKSFTEWLKTLKKLPASEIPATATRQEEKTVEQLAQVSITDREVVTEAMAEVWEKQGNAIKALELYEKLSLLDPSKSSYFAAKIEHLKQL
jgi:hypothetical protein